MLTLSRLVTATPTAVVKTHGGGPRVSAFPAGDFRFRLAAPPRAALTAEASNELSRSHCLRSARRSRIFDVINWHKGMAPNLNLE